MVNHWLVTNYRYTIYGVGGEAVVRLIITTGLSIWKLISITVNNDLIACLWIFLKSVMLIHLNFRC